MGSAVCASAASVSRRDESSQTLVTCLSNRNIGGTANTAAFTQLKKTYNLRLPYTPEDILVPHTVQQISDALICAGQLGIKVQARSGGHSYASFSSGGKNGSLVIDLRQFQEVTLDDKGVAKVGGGLRLGNLAQNIFQQGNRALSHGTCPGVGVGGHFTHGGYGYASRIWGLAMDQIVGLDVVLANGTAVHASETEHPDLYYVSHLDLVRLLC